MKEYINYVISIINSEGEEINLSASKKDTKHVRAFLRLNALGFDNTSLKDYINDSGYRVTGFELTKFLASKGNIVLCHTDVYNCFSNIKEAILIRPEIITSMQFDSLVRMIHDLSDFHIHYGIAHYRNSRGRKIIYQRTDYENFMNCFSLTKESGGNMQIDNNTFQENCLVVIDEEGRIIAVPRIPGEKNHGEAFSRLEKLVPDILAGFPDEKRNQSGGYEFSSFAAANGMAVFWPSDINNPEIMIVTLPQVPENKQSKQVEYVFPALAEFSVYVCTAHFKSSRSPRIITTSLSSSGDFIKAFEKLRDYLAISTMLNEPEHIKSEGLPSRKIR